jgi:hypothetical protein
METHNITDRFHVSLKMVVQKFYVICDLPAAKFMEPRVFLYIQFSNHPYVALNYIHKAYKTMRRVRATIVAVEKQ